MEILAGFWKYFGRFGFFGRKTATDPPESVSSSEDPPEQSGPPNSSRIWSVLRVGQVTGSIWTALASMAIPKFTGGTNHGTYFGNYMVETHNHGYVPEILTR